MEMENIEYFWNPVIRTYKGNYLVRTYIQQPKHIKRGKAIQIYDENENKLTIDDVKKDKKIVSILEGLGIKFTSNSFHLELCLRQVMILDDKPIFNKCLIQMGSGDHKISKSEPAIKFNHSDGENDMNNNTLRTGDLEKNENENLDLEKNENEKVLDLEKK